MDVVEAAGLPVPRVDIVLPLGISFFTPFSRSLVDREYRRRPEPAARLNWHPNFVTTLALVVSLFGMWQRIEFLYFQF